jgi:hypothetical protein
MSLTMKRSLLVVLLVAALLATLVVGIVKVNASQAPLPGHHSGLNAGKLLAWYCPAPPFEC